MQTLPVSTPHHLVFLEALFLPKCIEDLSSPELPASRSPCKGSRECRTSQAGTDVPEPCALPHGHSLCPTICSRGNEDTEYSGEVELPYGKTKAMAEKIVLEANGKKVQSAVVAPLELQHRTGERREMAGKTPQLLSKCASNLCLHLMHDPHGPKPPKARYSHISHFPKIKECFPSRLCFSSSRTVTLERAVLNQGQRNQVHLVHTQ